MEIVGAANRIAQANETTNQKSDATEHNKRIREGAAIGVAGGILIVAIWQGIIFRQQLEIGNAAAVSITGVSLRTYGSKNDKGELLWYFTPEVENSGNTPTQGLVLKWGADYIWALADKPASENDAWGSQAQKARIQTIAIGSHVKMSGLTLGTDAAFVNGILKNRAALYITASATYRDVFGRKHVTEFCAQISVPNRDYSTTSDEVFRTDPMQCPSHNCMDDECKDQ